MENTVTTIATGQADTLPDKTRIKLEIIAEGDTAEAARQAVADHEATLRETLLTETSLSLEQIRATGFEVRHREDQFDPSQTGSDYRAVKDVQVDTQPGHVGDIVVIATDAGASVASVGFSITDSTRGDLEKQALANAMEKAREQSETLASVEDATVGTVLNVETREPSGMQTIVDDALEIGSDHDFQPSPISVSGEVEVTYELIQN
ncbi:SIMPL domain-containing protein [Natronorubrum bangense]|nr:SIMPL domain-containing protein [Natronorubrum bangense]ELY45608.1 hypothetical protein C494_15193 [Natronorubrum bangense JCM 10635]